MSTLSFMKQEKFEKLFDMKTWYVLNFSNRTFQWFVADSIWINIYEKYPNDSKAWILRNIIKDFPDIIVWKLLWDLLEYYKETFYEDIDDVLFESCKKIVSDLKNNTTMKEIFIEYENDKNYNILLDEIRQANTVEKPEVIVDRLHTLCTKFIRDKANSINISEISWKSLNALFWIYIKELEKQWLIENEITKNILKHNISILEKFNEVRNNKSLAHDNQLLSTIEATYIVNNIIELVNFIEKMDGKIQIKMKEQKDSIEFSIEDIPF